MRSILSLIEDITELTFMPDHSKPEKKKGPPPSEDIQVPPIPKQTAGAVTGAAIGSIAGPIGAVVGGVVGALAGKASASGRPVLPAARKTVARAVRKTKAVVKTAKRAKVAVRKTVRAKKSSKSRSKTKKTSR